MTAIRSIPPFLLEAPDYTLNNDAKRVVAGLSGDIIAVFTIYSPGVTFNTAKVTFKVSGIKNGDRLYVFSKAGGSWNRVEASVVGDEHVRKRSPLQCRGSFFVVCTEKQVDKRQYNMIYLYGI